MLNEMPESVYQDWMDYYKHNPWDNQNTQLAMILSVLTGKPSYDFGIPKQQQTIDELKAGFILLGLM